jgi:hypothetical protein
MKLLEFMFQSVWRFIGVLILLNLIGCFILGLFERGDKKDDKRDD